MNYGLVLISHSQDKVMKNEKGEEYNQIVPTLDKRGRLICSRTCDIIGYSTPVTDSEGKTTTRLYMRETPRYMAGSRFKYMKDSIEFNYDNLVNAITEAIDAEEAAGSEMTNERISYENEVITYDFNAMMKEFQEIVSKIMNSNPSNAAKITQIVEMHLGKGKKVNDCTAENAEQLDMILFDLRRL